MGQTLQTLRMHRAITPSTCVPRAPRAGIINRLPAAMPPERESGSAVPEDLRGWLSRWVAAHNAHDVDQLVEFVSADLVWKDPAMFGQELVGRQAFREMLNASFGAFPDLHVEQGAPMLGAETPRVAVPWRLHGTFKHPLRAPASLTKPLPKVAPTGRNIDLQGVDIYDFEDMLLLRCHAVHDMFTLSHQLGLLPSPSSPLARLCAPVQWVGAAVMRRRER